MWRTKSDFLLSANVMVSSNVLTRWAYNLARLIRGCFSFSQCFRAGVFSSLSPPPHRSLWLAPSPPLLGSFNMAILRVHCALKENACTARLHCRLTVKTLRLTVTSILGAWGGGGGRAFGKLCVPLKTSWLRPCALQSKEPSPGVTWIFFSVAVCNMSEITHSSPFKDAGLQAEVYTSTLIVCWPLLQPVIIISQAINAKNLNYTELKPSRCRLLRLLSPPNSKINALSLNLNIVRLNRSFFFWNRLNTI